MTSILKSIQRTPFEWVEIDQSLCANVYGVSPCAAILGTTGETKCYNTRASCQDPANYDGSDKLTLRFCANRGVIPDDYYYLPYLQSAQVSAAKINPGGGNENMAALGTRATLSVSFSDHPHTDRLVDPYLEDRNFIAYERSTFWAKWRARNPYYMHRVIRHKSGFIDPITMLPDPATLITRTFFITGFNGPDSDGNVNVKAQDLLTLAANEKATAPRASTGKLIAAIDETQTTLTLTPSGVGNSEYPASGSIRIDSEIMTFTRTGDDLAVVRGQNNTPQGSHELHATVQLCLIYTSQAPKDILEDLLVNFADIDPIYLDTAQWAVESNDFLPRLYSAIISEPTGVTELISEMCEQMYFIAFWDEREALLKMRAVRPAENESITDLNDEINLIENSVTWSDRPDQLITQVWVYYAQRNPTDSTTDARNFGALDVIGDPSAESSDRNGLAKIKTIYSRWMQGVDGAAAIELGNKILDRYNEIPKEVNFSVDAKDRNLWLADFINLTNRNVVDFTGSIKSVPMQVVSAQESLQGTVYSYSAIEYSGEKESSITDEYTIAISTDQVNVNLRTLFDSLYDIEPTSGMKIRFTIRAGVVIGGSCANKLLTQQSTYSSSMRLTGHFVGVPGGNPVGGDFTILEGAVNLPFISRHNITTDKTYNYVHGGVSDIYNDPDTGTPTAFSASCKILEKPAVASLTVGNWPSGVQLFLDVAPGAIIAGEAGTGGNHWLHKASGDFISSGIKIGNFLAPNLDIVRAGDGGHALDITYPISINNLGIIAGGGGGGNMILSAAWTYRNFVGADSITYDNRRRMGLQVLSGGGGAGFRNQSVNNILLRGQDAFSDIEIPLPANGALYTQPSSGNKAAIGYGSKLKYDVYTVDGGTGSVSKKGYYDFISGNGGELASNGGSSSIISTAPVIVESITLNNRNKAGLAGYAIKDGKELITWLQKGDVRGAEY